MSKRQLNLLSFFKRKEENDDAKRTRSETTLQEGGCGTEQVQDATGAVNEQEAITAMAPASQDQQQGEAGLHCSSDLEGEESACSGEEVGTSGDRSGMECTIWTEAQFSVKQSCYPWLVMDKSRLGCTTCKAVGSLGPEKTGGMKLAKEWVMCTQQTLRKKVFEHARTKAHLAAADILEKAKGGTIVQAIVNSQLEQITTTARVFRTAYKEAKRHRPAYGFEQEIDCQVLNGVDMGRILHSNVACSNIPKHISEEMKRKQFEKIVQCAPKLSLMLDESTSLNKKSALIIYVRVQLPGMDMPTNIFTELVELDDLTAEGIVRHILSALERLNLTEEFLSKTLIGVTCDGASLMLGRTTHRLELAVGDVVKEIGAINYLKILMDKLYAIYSASNKSRMELKDAAESLDVQLCKIGRILDTRWVASSFRTVEAVWKKLPGTLQIQKRESSIISAHKAICRQIRVFEAMAERPGRYTELSQRVIDANSFQGVPLHEGKLRDKTLNQRLFFSSLTEVESLCRRFDIDSHSVIRAYREYRDSDGKCIHDQLKELFAAVNSISISSADCERGFSQMNLICSPNRASLHTSTISYLLFLNLVGPPLSKFNPVPYVRSWIAKGHRTATDIRSKTRNREEENHDIALVWGVLDN
uniref:HAT C-terminal dimerisation domain-containing protein n=1 Tax=Sinocyclocheilus anshuiensis TaxID=1608454 RepID=A0A671MGA9_9TELE